MVGSTYMRRAKALISFFPIALIAACATDNSSNVFPDVTGGGSGNEGGGGSGEGGGGGIMFDGGTSDDGGGLDPDASCAAVVEKAEAKFLPVDIIWMVDNSSSMQPAVAEVKAGLNDFAALIGQKSLDYRVIMLALRSKTSPLMVGGEVRYPVCIPPPLAGDNNCGDGPNFFQSSVDILSTQPLEQFLGTLGQTAGYMVGEAKGGDPWMQFLRPQATKTIVIVTDDNARLVVNDFEHFKGGKNPWNSLTLPPGILEPSWNGLFNNYIFSGIYGWGSDVDPEIPCEYPDGSKPPSAGPTYTELVKKTGGVRAKICDGQAAWKPFFDQVAQAVVETSKLSCEIVIPAPSMGSIDYGKVNVKLTTEAADEFVVFVGEPAKCAATGGWYYDDPANPAKVMLCPASCDEAQKAVGPGKMGSIEILFGCETIVN
ncbi:MAG: hypothetical protein HUU21_12825 [Polyangiaceae bacterium]|nr:hypothetical protein [Polyangiaceae bacterium]